MQTFFLLILAISPCLAIAAYINLKDKHHPVPIKTLYMSVFYGVLSFGLALGLQWIILRYAHIDPENIAHQVIKALIFVGLIEEASKFLFLRGIIFNYKDFKHPFDGIVYCVMVSMGFAVAENILYVLNGDGGAALVRMFTAVPAHGMFAIIMGFFLGEAKVFRTSSFLYMAMALGFATFAHEYYDYFLFLSFVPGLWFNAIVSLIIIVGITQYAIKLRNDEDYKGY